MRRATAGAALLVVAACAASACDQFSKLTGGEAEPEATASASASATATASASATKAAKAAPSASAADEAAKKADPSRLTIEGEAKQGALLLAKVDKGWKKISFPGHRVVISDEGHFLIAFFRNAPKKEKLTITFDDGSVLERNFEIEQRTFEVDKIDGLPKHMVDLSVARRKKLANTNKRVEKLRKGYTKAAHYADGFIWPCAGRITSRYGQERILNGKKSGIHWGIDIAAPVGTPVKAPAAGRVVFAERGVPLSGDLLIIDHGHGLTSSLLHLNGFTKKVGDEVKQGEAVAAVGMTGRTNGPHLDWRMNMFEIRIDPELLMPPHDGKVQ